MRLLSKWTLLLILLAGCSPPALDYVEVKRLHETLTDAEIQSWIQVVKLLPDEKLTIFPQVFTPPPDWSSDRSLAVRELVAVEEEKIVERWDRKFLAESLKDERDLKRALRKVGLTLDQFVGLTLSLGVSYSRTLLLKHQDLDRIQETGEPVVKMLRNDLRAYSSLGDEVQYHILQESIWLTRLDRAAHLAIVPSENAAMIQKYQEQLQATLPDEFLTNPLTVVENQQQEWGTPFNVLDERDDDKQLTWDPADLVRGSDEPDPEFQ